jgi:hypothetical protein
VFRKKSRFGFLTVASTILLSLIGARTSMAEEYRKVSIVRSQDGPDAITLTSPQIEVEISGPSEAGLRYTAANGNVVQIPGSPFVAGTTTCKQANCFTTP